MNHDNKLLNFAFWKNASTRRKRIYSSSAIFVLATLVTIAGTLVPLSAQEAQAISDNLQETVNTLSETGGLTQFIFGNNFMICLLMFIPVIGPLFGFFVLFNTGTVIGGIAATQGVPGVLAFLALVLTPVFWLEFIAYSIAITQSFWLIRRIMRRRIWLELKTTGLLVTICAVLLLIGAIVETALLALI
jgi:hypothetical protein